VFVLAAVGVPRALRGVRVTEQQPLGHMNRARRWVYESSAQLRGVAQP
jgi:hypothetical protein